MRLTTKALDALEKQSSTQMLDSPEKVQDALDKNHAAYSSVQVRRGIRPPSAQQRVATAMNADLVQLDDYNPLDIGDSISQAANNEQMRRERHRRVSSTFSTYYLNTRAKDLASLASL